MAKKAEIEIVTFDAINADESRTGLKGSPTQVRKTFVPVHNVNNQMIEGTTAEKAQKLSEILLNLRTEVK